MQKEFLLKNKNGIEVAILSTGASVDKIVIPDKIGNFRDVALGFEDKKDYMNNPLFAGSALGPVAGRISGAKIDISGETYHLTKNDGENNLHGGFDNISFVEWDGDFTDDRCLVLQTTLADGVDGFPGNRTFTAKYSLDDDNCLTMVYTAVSDKDTYFNLSNHTYFNLSGDFSRNALEQKMTMRASKYIKNDSNNIPCELAAVEGTPFDFRASAVMQDGANKDSDLQQNGYNNGFAIDNGFALDSTTNWENNPAMVLEDTQSGRQMKIFTDAECVVIYSGKFIPDNMILHGSVKSSPSCAIAIEAQDFTDALNCPFLEGRITKAGEVYTRTIRYKFGIAD